jgi:regulator of sigma E protease
VTWVLAAVGFCALIVLHEFGHFAAAKAVGMRVERFALFFPPLLFKVKRGETEYGIGAIPLGGYVRITGMNPNEEIPKEVEDRAYYKQKVWKRVVVIGAGPAMNFLIAFLIFFFLFWSNGLNKATTDVSSVVAGSPAAVAQLHKGEHIVAVDGVRGSVDTLSKQIATHTCAGKPTPGCVAKTPVRLTVQSAVPKGDGSETVTRTVSIVPKYDGAAKRMRVGISFGTSVTPLGPAGAAGQSVSSMWQATSLTVSRLSKLFYSEQARKQVSGVVGSYEVTRQAFGIDLDRALSILGLISLSLAIVNLFPFLPLDGGHIFWALAEKVRGRPISFKVMERASVVGFMLVIFLFAIGLSNDIGRLQGAGFGTQ